jgi:hypothetical protein
LYGAPVPAFLFILRNVCETLQYPAQGANAVKGRSFTFRKKEKTGFFIINRHGSGVAAINYQ